MVPPAQRALPETTPEDRLLLANRVSVVAALLALTPILLTLVALPTRRLQLQALGAPLFITLNAETLLLLCLPVLAVVGADWTLRAHPLVRAGEVQALFPFWIAPGLSAFWVALALGQAQSWALWIATLFFGTLLISALTLAEYYTLSPQPNQHTLARNVVLFANYLIAFASFTLIYGIRERSLVSATATLLVALAIAVDLLVSQRIPAKRAVVYALTTAWAVGQSTWAMNYWNISDLSAGLMLLGIFHFAVGLSRLVLTDSISRRAVLTHAVMLGLLAALALALAGA